MNYYIDIKIKNKTKRPKNRIMNKVFTSLHRRFCDLKNETIGISFPFIDKFDQNTGDTLRIHGTAEDLIKLNQKEWLKEKEVSISKISEIPEKHSFITVNRIQTKLSNSKLNRLIKRNNMSKKDVLEYRKKMLSSPLKNAYLELESESTKRLFKLFFNVVKKDSLSKGLFDSYGLSNKGTVPLF